jgi:phage tail sheath protein FI
VAAGVVAARERRLGLPWGPANELAVGVVTADDPVPDSVHDELHRLGVNVFRAERDGFRLTSARTLSRDARYRQLSVRRLMTMIMLAVERQANALVFEPNTADLRATVTHTLTEFLRALYAQGAFAGDTEQSSFFVHCDDRLNPPEALALGRLTAEIGVAPSSPLEYLVLRISQDVDGTAAVTPVAAPTSAAAP